MQPQAEAGSQNKPPSPSGRRPGWKILLGFLILLPPAAVSASGVDLQFNNTPPVKIAPDNPAAALENAFTQVAKAVSPAVVNISSEWTEHILTYPNFGNMQDFFNWFYGGQNAEGMREYPRKQRSLGSGFLITPDGYVLTNGHVVGKADKITVYLENGRDYVARVVGKDEKTDIALLKIDAGDQLPCISLGDSDAIEVGQWAIAIGDPFGLDHTLTSGVISAKGRSVNLNENSPYASYIQTDASINPGNSGGPLCNLKGQVIGINTAIYSQSGGNIGIGFAIPSNVARKVARDLAKTGTVTRAGIGATIQGMDLKMAQSFGLPDAQGVLLSNINKGSAAEKAGLRPGDVILEVDGESVAGPADPIAKFYQKSPGDHVHLILQREGKVVTADVELKSIESEPQAQAPGKRLAEQNEAALSAPDLGLTFQDPSPEIRAQMNPSSPQGPVLLDVKPDGPAGRAGLKAGDVVIRAGGKTIADAAEFDRILKKANMKKGIRLFIWREGVTMYCFLQSGE